MPNDMSVSRQFDDRDAVREQVPLLVGLVGASGSGKTYSALRLATGIQQVSGGEIFYIDTEARRALHYADQFKFRHLDFRAPFSPLDYLAAIEHCKAKGAKVVVIDSMSHEHEGPGGVLEEHDAEAVRLAALWKTSIDKTNIPAWSVPKAKRRKLINGVLQMGINAIFCFRAKEKIKIVSGKQPVQLGWMPIAGEEMVYEMTVNCLLYPGSGGVPMWQPEEKGEKVMIKLPEQFKPIFAEVQPLCEGLGIKLAEWARGSQVEVNLEILMLAGVHAAEKGKDERNKWWASLTSEQRNAIKAHKEKQAAAPQHSLGKADPKPVEQTTEEWLDDNSSGAEA